MKPKILVIPDVHGRTFWKNVIDKFPKEEYPGLKIIFLGDYLDPYSNIENIWADDALNNFLEIIEYINNDSRIIPLIGNHDWHYFVNLDTCRMDRANARKIEKLFIDNMAKFRLTYSFEINNRKYLFSHAGITQKWLDDIAIDARYEIDNWNSGGIDIHKDPRWQWLSEIRLINESYNFELLEECLKHYDETFYTAPISMISRERGGWNMHGSCIWADIREHIYNDDLQGYLQVFAHTNTYPNYVPYMPENRNWVMIDCRKAFIIYDEGVIDMIN